MWKYNYTPSSDDIMHYGVQGMRWGHRKKYYTSNGTLNSLGKARKNYENAKEKRKQLAKENRKRGMLAIGYKGIEKSLNIIPINLKNLKKRNLILIEMPCRKLAYQEVQWTKLVVVNQPLFIIKKENKKARNMLTKCKKKFKIDLLHSLQQVQQYLLALE